MTSVVSLGEGWPLLHAMGERADLADLVKKEDEVPRLVEAMHEMGSFRYATSVTERYANDAIEIARSLDDVPEREALESLVGFVTDRIPSSAAA